jgi:hypothetical protein
LTQTATDICVLEHRVDPERPRQALDGAYLCAGHHTELERLIAEMPARYDALGRILAAGGNGSKGPRVSGTTEKPLPINPAVASHRQQIQHDLVWWAIYIADERGIDKPGNGNPHTTAAWLTTHIDWCAANKVAAEELLPVLRELTGRAWAMIDPDGTKRITIGPCNAHVEDEPCDGVLYATVRADDDPRPSLIYCDTCDLEKSSIEWLRFGRTYKQGPTERERMSA